MRGGETGGTKPSRVAGSGTAQPFPPVSPRGEWPGGCGRPPAALRGFAAKLRPFLFRRFLPFSLGPALRVPRPRARPPRPRLAFPRMQRWLPSEKGWARLPGATAPPPGRSRCGAGAVPGGARVCGRGFCSAPAPAALRREGDGGGTARGRAPRCSYCALAAAGPPLPQKNAAAAATKPIAVCITSCLLLFLPGPRAPPGWGGTGTQCALLGWKRPNAHMGGSAGVAQPSPPGGCGGKIRRLLRGGEGGGWLAAEPRCPPD